MALDLNGWDMHDIHVKMRGMSVVEIILLYKDHQRLLAEKSQEYMTAIEDENETAKERTIAAFDHVEKEKCVIALKLAEEMIKNK
jgi:hypothetical protein